MTRSKYLSLLLRNMTAKEIALSAKNPTQYMTKTHILLHYVALKKLGFV